MPGSQEPFLLFLSGPPTIREVRPLAPHILPAMTFRTYQGPSEPWGDWEPGDVLPDQVYGEQGRCGRMVLELAARAGVSVKIVNVEDPGEDRILVSRWVGPDEQLPMLVRPDGATLSGEADFVPAIVKRFLAGP